MTLDEVIQWHEKQAEHFEPFGPKNALTLFHTSCAEALKEDNFKEAWKFMQAKGYQYGKEELELVKVGWTLHKDIVLIQEAVKYGQFADDMPQQLPKNVREAIIRCFS